MYFLISEVSMYINTSIVMFSLNDVAQVCEIARKVGAIVIADGVSYAPHTIPDVKALGIDFYAYSTYKTFGPHQGVLWGSPDALKKTEGQSHWFNEEKRRLDSIQPGRSTPKLRHWPASLSISMRSIGIILAMIKATAIPGPKRFSSWWPGTNPG